MTGASRCEAFHLQCVRCYVMNYLVSVVNPIRNTASTYKLSIGLVMKNCGLRDEMEHMITMRNRGNRFPIIPLLRTRALQGPFRFGRWLSVHILNDFHFQDRIIRCVKILRGTDREIFLIEKPVTSFRLSDFACYHKLNLSYHCIYLLFYFLKPQ
jgi:hypothetical protein